MTVRSTFLFLGGHPVFDFLNTEMVSGGAKIDALVDPESLLRWLVMAKLIGRPADVHVTGASLRDVKRVRSSIRRVIEAMADGKKPAAKDVAAVDRQLRRGTGSLSLRLDGADFRFGFEPGKAGGADPRFVIARAAAEFLAVADPARVRRCHGARCILLYYDGTKSGTRRWCSMASCGNRQKAALHYERVRRGD